MFFLGLIIGIVLALIAILIMCIYLYQKEFLKWHNGVRPMTDEAEKQMLIKDMEKEFKKVDKLN